MKKSVLITIIVLLGIVVIGAIYFLMKAPNGNPVGNTPSSNTMNNQNNQPASFDIQGMKVEILKQGTEPSAKSGDSVTVNYVGTLENGTKFDSSIDRNTPFTFPLGGGRVIKGWDLGIVGMKIGEKRKLTIPAELGYGVLGFPPVIPSNATLIFEVELLKINQ